MRPANISCPYCGSPIKATRSGQVASHLSPGGVRCFAIGLKWRKAVLLRNQRDAFRKMT